MQLFFNPDINESTSQITFDREESKHIVKVLRKSVGDDLHITNGKGWLFIAEITLADIPGLVEGAHEGVGLGIQFLKHIERCKTLIHLIDITDENIENTYQQVKKELRSYSMEILKKKEIIILNKTDLLNKKEIDKIVKNFSKDKDSEVVTLSTLNKESVSKIKAKLLSYVS